MLIDVDHRLIALLGGLSGGLGILALLAGGPVFLQFLLQGADLSILLRDLVAELSSLLIGLLLPRSSHGGQNQKPHKCDAHRQPDDDIHKGMQAGILLQACGHRLDDGLISDAVSHRLLFLLAGIPLLDGHRPGFADLVEFMHIPQGDLIRLIQIVGCPQHGTGAAVLLRMDIEEGQKLIGLHRGGVRRHHLLQLYDSQVLPVLPGIIQALVKPLHCLVDGLQLSGNFLYFADIIVGDIVVGLNVLA